METRGKMSNLGWNISNVGDLLLTENGSITNTNTVIARALDLDIRDFGEAVLGSLQKLKNTEKIILQIQKIRNVASPKSKEDSEFAPRMLKLILTDGHTTCQAIEVSNISFLSRSHTPPGSKLLLNGAKIASGCILLEPNCCVLLGGRVPTLCEKWELVKNISKNIRSVGTDGAPPWVNFGEKIISSTLNEPFKALADKSPNETTNEFDLHRQDAISSATTGAVKKVFGGGVKQPVSFNKPVKHFNNQEFNKPRFARGSKSKGDSSEKIEKPQKPQEKVSLFDFLEDKLLVNQVDDKHVDDKTLERGSIKYNEFNQTKNSNHFSSEHGQKAIKNKPHNLGPTKNSYMGNQSSSYVRNQPKSYKANPTNSYVGNPASSYVGNQTNSYVRNQNNSYVDNQTSSYVHNQPNSYADKQTGLYMGNQASFYMGKQTSSYVGNQTSSYGGNPTSTKIPSKTDARVSTDDYNRIYNQNNKTPINELSKNMAKVSFDTQFAARSLKQHLNLYSNKKADKSSNSNTDSTYNWKLGDLCMAKYWEDGKYYNAVVTNLTQNTCVVTFNGYGNIEEVLKVDCIPLDVDDHASNTMVNSSYKKEPRGTREYRSNKRPYTNKSINAGNDYYQS